MIEHDTPQDNKADVPSNIAQSGRHSGPTVPPSKKPKIPLPPPGNNKAAVNQRARKRRGRRRNSGADWAWVVVAGAIFGVAVILGLAVVFMLQAPANEPEIAPEVTDDLSALPTAIVFRTELEQQFESGDVVTLDNGYSIVLEPWDGESRWTVLAMGLDRRPGETGLAYRTDTMMIISLDPDTQSIGILSVPRDLWVVVPGYAKRWRVNFPMYLGEARRDMTGPELTMQTVQHNLGIRLHDYLIVDFKAVIDLVDIVGGIDVSIDYTINDPEYPDMNFGYDPFYLPAGEHHLMGYDALRFARTRHGSSDIDRAARQQQVIFAIRERILNLDMLPQLIVQAPTLLRSYEDNVYTSLSLDQMIRLAWYIKDIPVENITTGVIGFEYLDFFETENEEQVLILDQGRISILMAQIFGPDYSE